MNSQYFLSEFHAWGGGARETAHWVMCLLCKEEDWSWDPSTYKLSSAPTCNHRTKKPQVKGKNLPQSSNHMHIHTHYTCEHVYTEVNIKDLIPKSMALI